ncbi:MAG: lipopolysaccharide biosynthesis protein [Candidatus Binataceae bacterium]
MASNHAMQTEVAPQLTQGIVQAPAGDLARGPSYKFADAGRSAAAVPRNIAWSYVSWVLSIIAPLVLIPFYVRFLGARLYGEWLVILSLTSYLALANLGMGQTVGNRIAEAIARGRSGEVGRLVSTAFFTYAAIAVLLIGLIVAATPLFAHRFLPGAGGMAAPAFAVYVVLSALAFPTKVHQMALRSFERVDREQAINAGAIAGRIVLVITVLVAGFKLVAIATINGGSMLAAGAAAYIIAIRLKPEARPRTREFSPSLLRAMLKPSAAFLALQIGVTLIVGLDNLVIGYAMDGAAVTRYAVPFRLIWMAAGPFAVAIAALTPTVTVNYARDRKPLLADGLMLSSRLALMYAACGTILLWLAGPAFISVWAGQDVFPGMPTYAMEVAFFFIIVLMSAPSTILFATTRHYLWAALTIFEGLLNLGLSLWWVHTWGLAGVIAGTVVASLLTNAWYIPAAAFHTVDIPLGWMGRKLWPTAALAMVAVSVSVAVSMFTSSLALSTALPLAAVLALIFALAFGWLCFSAEERQIARTWLMATLKTRWTDDLSHAG